MLFVDYAAQQQHSEQTKKAARRAVDQRHNIAAEHGREHDPDRDEQGDLVGLVVIDGVDGDDVGEPELYARDGKRIWYLQLNDEDDERNRAQYGELGNALGFHHCATASAPPSLSAQAISK